MSFHKYVIYQIYPKSFYDTKGDGFGDLRGIIDKIPYIASLGVDMVWFNPFFVSPQRDNGYDIADYYQIQLAMGTMDDFDELVEQLAAHNIGVMLDMVFNHTSTAHEWFQKALAGDEKYRDYYIIRPGLEDGSPPTNWESKFGGSAWEPFGDTGEFYLHLFDVTQADLNWRNPKVREEMANIVNFWMDRGVFGFRFDVINLIGKEAELKSSAPGEDPRWMYTDGQDVDQYLKELAAASFGKDPRSITVGEMSSTSIERCVGYSNPDNHELNMVFNFHHLKVDYQDGNKWTNVRFQPRDLKRVLNEWAMGMQAGNGWNAVFLNNHDQPRALNRFGDPEHYHAESATMLAHMMHLLRGTPYIYMGEEIGMTDPEYTTINDYADIESTNAYIDLLEKGIEAEEAFAIVHSKSRDNARTPMQWDDTIHAGFTNGVPWLSPTNHDRINVALEEDSGRILPYYRKLIQLRKQYPVISEGTYEPFQIEHEKIYAYFRKFQDDELLVIVNLSSDHVDFEIPEKFVAGDVLIENYSTDISRNVLQLSPYHAIAIVSKEHPVL